MFVIIIGLIAWFVGNESKSIQKIIMASLLGVLGLVFCIIKLIKKKKDLANGIPVKDEFINKIKFHAGAKAFMLLLYYWLLIFWLNSAFSDRRELLGIGILGSILIYGICSWYYKSTADFDEK